MMSEKEGIAILSLKLGWLSVCKVSIIVHFRILPPFVCIHTCICKLSVSSSHHFIPVLLQWVKEVICYTVINVLKLFWVGASGARYQPIWCHYHLPKTVWAHKLTTQLNLESFLPFLNKWNIYMYIHICCASQDINLYFPIYFFRIFRVTVFADFPIC